MPVALSLASLRCGSRPNSGQSSRGWAAAGCAVGIAVDDVEASSRWYQRLLGVSALPEHEHRDSYDRVFCDGHLILQLHAWDEEDHPNLVNADAAPMNPTITRFVDVGLSTIVNSSDV